ncbi:hypothetical protein F8M41_016536 [Gigaspora margarita]|uniref:Uncharacterized protein n=1 Tax=Gigaspora margarita TaxID=4874 RepID=A0A8H4B346_GIGMA|nr:hypothetical protein F8M41_016536 [Gigaspora margarita]
MTTDLKYRLRNYNKKINNPQTTESDQHESDLEHGNQLEQNEHTDNQYEHDFEQQRHDIEQRENDLKQREHDLKQREHDLEQREHDLERREHEYEEPENVIKKFFDLWSNPELRTDMENGLDSYSFQLVKKKEAKTIDENDTELWMKGLKASDIKACHKIYDDIKNEAPENIEWEDIKNEYDNLEDKETYIKTFYMDWLSDKPGVIAKNQKCSINDVILKRLKYFLLGNYIIQYYPNNIKDLKYNFVNYQRVANLYDIIGKNFLELPMPSSFFSKHDNGYKVESLIKWFMQDKGKLQYIYFK